MSRARGALACGVGLAALALGAAEAARLVDVRVGRHEGFVRVVFETDVPAEFTLEPGWPGAPGGRDGPEGLERRLGPDEGREGELGEHRVRIAAAASVRAPEGADPAVTLEPLPDGGTLARIRTAAPVRIESQVLDLPPRLVFDLHPAPRAEADEALEVRDRPAREAAAAAPGDPSAGDETSGAETPGGETEPPGPAGSAGTPADAVDVPGTPLWILEEVPEAPEAEGDGAEEPPAAPAAPLLAPELADPRILPELAPPLVADPEAFPGLAAQEEEPSAEPPPVSAPPPASLAGPLDQRSLVLGLAGGVVIGIGAASLARSRRARAEAGSPPAEALPTQEPVPQASPAPAAPAAPADMLASDLLVMIQRLDERFAASERTLGQLVERAERLERRTRLQDEELASQRVALARLDRALGRTLPRPVRERPAASDAATAPPRRPGG